MAVVVAREGWWCDATTGELVRRVGGPASLIDPNTAGGVQPVGMTGKTLTFSDEFEAGSLDTSKWIPYYPDTDFWNATQPGGHLTNTNEPEAYDISGISFPEESIMRLTMRDESTVEGLPYTSGMVCSYPSFNQTYGVFEARLKFPDIDGAWGGFWMDPTDMIWPPEIDIAEDFSKASFHTQMSQGYIDPVAGNNATSTDVPGLTPNDWHVYSCEWREGIITWLIDGTITKTYTGETPAKDFYLLCNLAGRPDPQSPVPADMPFWIDVDYIRAWA